MALSPSPRTAAAGDAHAVLVVTPLQIPASRVCQERHRLSRPIMERAAIGAALGRLWRRTHDETRKSFGIAGPRVMRISSLDGRHPEASGSLREVAAHLVAEIG